MTPRTVITHFSLPTPLHERLAQPLPDCPSATILNSPTQTPCPLFLHPGLVPSLLLKCCSPQHKEILCHSFALLCRWLYVILCHKKIETLSWTFSRGLWPVPPFWCTLALLHTHKNIFLVETTNHFSLLTNILKNLTSFWRKRSI